MLEAEGERGWEPAGPRGWEREGGAAGVEEKGLVASGGEKSWAHVRGVVER